MTEPLQAAAVSHGRMDPGSRRTLARFVFRLCCLTFFIVLPYFAGLRSFSVMLELLSTFTSVGSIFCTVLALLCGEFLGRGSLNHWDEALAYMALTRLVHVIQIYHA